MPFYKPIANVGDFNRFGDREEQQDAWSSYVRDELREEVSNSLPFHFPLVSALHKSPLSKNSSPRGPYGTYPAQPVTITWNAFPRRLIAYARSLTAKPSLVRSTAFAAADTLEPMVVELRSRQGGSGLSFHQRRYVPGHVPPMLLENEDETLTAFHLWRRQQDEYLEWHPVRENGRLKKLIFSCEPYDYWQINSRTSDRDSFCTLFRDVSETPAVSAELFYSERIFLPFYRYYDGEDFKFARYVTQNHYGQNFYNPFNTYTTTRGIAHTSHHSNTLASEIDLARRAAYEYGRFASSSFSLTAAGNLGDINRNSDPVIASAVNAWTRKHTLTISDPVGVYVGEIALEGFKAPDGSPLHEIGVGLHILRPTQLDVPARILRFEVRPPDGACYDLQSCTLDGEPILYGGQIAERVQMVIDAEVYPITPSSSPEYGETDFKACAHTGHPGLWAQVVKSKDCDDIQDIAWDLLTPVRPKDPAPDIPEPADLVGLLKSLDFEGVAVSEHGKLVFRSSKPAAEGLIETESATEESAAEIDTPAAADDAEGRRRVRLVPDDPLLSIAQEFLQ